MVNNLVRRTSSVECYEINLLTIGCGCKKCFFFTQKKVSRWKNTLSDIAEINCPEITRSYHIFPVYGMKNKNIHFFVCVSHPVSRNLKIHFPDTHSIKVANPASRKRPAGPLQQASMIFCLRHIFDLCRQSQYFPLLCKLFHISL